MKLVCSPQQGLLNSSCEAVTGGVDTASMGAPAKRARTTAGLSPEAATWGHFVARAQSAVAPAELAIAAPAFRRKGQAELMEAIMPWLARFWCRRKRKRTIYSFLLR